jgi:hypothetical protein
MVLGATLGAKNKCIRLPVESTQMNTPSQSGRVGTLGVSGQLNS